jgi:hypothetical protein
MLKRKFTVIVLTTFYRNSIIFTGVINFELAGGGSEILAGNFYLNISRSTIDGCSNEAWETFQELLNRPTHLKFIAIFVCELA